MTQLIEDLGEWRALRRRLLVGGKTIGFVPTMGALHAGHYSLVETARAQNQVTAVSIFVNPTQFNDRSDFDKYPRMIEQDVEHLARLGVDFVLAPAFEALYTRTATAIGCRNLKRVHYSAAETARAILTAF